jgi:CheY-like chemotaxis protein
MPRSEESEIMRRLLIVDDDEGIRKVCRTRLQDAYEIIDTGDPERAFLMALQNKPDAILMDLSMPGLSGFELCRTLSAVSITQQIPIFVVSGQDTRNKAFCESLGASGYFEKPIDFVKLKNTLGSALSLKGCESRKGTRVQYNAILKLKGKSKDGSYLEVRATTHDVSANGFLCVCRTPLVQGAVVDVFLCSGGEHYLGRAQAVKAEEAAFCDPFFVLQFIETKHTEEPKSFQEFLM